jgi:hypothetical protein
LSISCFLAALQGIYPLWINATKATTCRIPEEGEKASEKEIAILRRSASDLPLPKAFYIFSSYIKPSHILSFSADFDWLPVRRFNFAIDAFYECGGKKTLIQSFYRNLTGKLFWQ